MCGLGTKPEGQRCVPDDRVIIDTLISQNFINKDQEIVFRPDYNPNTQLPVPKWFEHWKEKGGYSSQRVIS